MEEKREEEEVLGLLIKEGAVVVVVRGEGEFNRVKDARGLEGSDGRGIMIHECLEGETRCGNG